MTWLVFKVIITTGEHNYRSIFQHDSEIGREKNKGGVELQVMHLYCILLLATDIEKLMEFLNEKADTSDNMNVQLQKRDLGKKVSKNKNFIVSRFRFNTKNAKTNTVP